MASKNKLIKRPKRKIVNWSGRAEKIRKFRALPFSNRTHFDTAQKATIRRLWEDHNYKNKRVSALRRGLSKNTLERLKGSGFDVEEHGLMLSRPRDSQGKIIKGVRLSVRKSGVIRQRVGDRVDFAVPLDVESRAAIISAADPEPILREILSTARVPQPGNTETKSYKLKKSRVFMRLNVDGSKTGILSFRDVADILRSWAAKNKQTFINSFFALEITEYKIKGKADEGKKRKKRRKR